MLNKPSMDIEKIEKDFKEEMETLFCNGKLEGYEFDRERSVFHEIIELHFNKGNEHYRLCLLRDVMMAILEDYRFEKWMDRDIPTRIKKYKEMK